MHVSPAGCDRESRQTARHALRSSNILQLEDRANDGRDDSLEEPLAKGAFKSESFRSVASRRTAGIDRRRIRECGRLGVSRQGAADIVGRWRAYILVCSGEANKHHISRLDDDVWLAFSGGHACCCTGYSTQIGRRRLEPYRMPSTLTARWYHSSWTYFVLRVYNQGEAHSLPCRWRDELKA